MQTQEQTQKLSNIGGGNRRGGRPVGSVAIIPPGHVGVEGLAAALGVSPSTVPGMMLRGDPRIPPRSPIAGSRRIWRICDVEALIGMPSAPATPTPQTPQTPQTPPTPASAFSAISVATLATSKATPDRDRRKPGRPRGTGKFRK